MVWPSSSRVLPLMEYRWIKLSYRKIKRRSDFCENMTFYCSSRLSVHLRLPPQQQWCLQGGSFQIVLHTPDCPKWRLFCGTSARQAGGRGTKKKKQWHQNGDAGSSLTNLCVNALPVRCTQPAPALRVLQINVSAENPFSPHRRRCKTNGCCHSFEPPRLAWASQTIQPWVGTGGSSYLYSFLKRLVKRSVSSMLHVTSSPWSLTAILFTWFVWPFPVKQSLSPVSASK